MIFERAALLGAGCTLLVVGGLAWSLSMGKAAVEKDRGLIVSWAEAACASVGKPYRVDAVDRPLARKAWGKACGDEILRLATNAAAAATASLTTVTTHETEQAAKRTNYAAAARRSSARIQPAEHQMEVAIAAAPDGLLGPEFFDGFNRSLGLRPYIAASAPAAARGGDAEGAAGRLADEVQ